MNSPNREEIDAKLATVEARLDGRVAAIQATIDGLVQRLDDYRRESREHERRTEEQFREMGGRITRVEKALGNLKTTMIVTAISAVIAIVLGVGAINATLFSNMIAAFEAGGNLSASQAEVKRQVEETAILLRQLQAQTPPAGSEAQPEAAPATPPKR